MRLYAGSSQQFYTDTIQNQIADKLKNSFFSYYRYNPSPGEVTSWRNSLRAISQVMQYAELMDHGVLLEYQLPLSSRRLDCMITGKDNDSVDNAIIVELKQWETCQESDGDNEVVTWLGGANRELLHPSAQVGQYSMYLKDTHTAFYEDNPVNLNACTYLHNYSFAENDALLTDKFKKLINHYPLFSGNDVDLLKTYLSDKLVGGEGIEVLARVEKSQYRPSKKLMEHVGNVISCNPEYILLDEQLVVYDKVFACARKGFHNKQKNVIIIKGGPGTGKSVIAINLMADLLFQEYNAHYATGSRAFTETLRKIIGTRGAVQFKYFNSYGNVGPNTVDVLICDESHRIREHSWSRFIPKPKRTNKLQIEELINAAKVCVFFIDDRQVVRPNEVGSTDHITKYAKNLNCEIYNYKLDVQFRCAGSESFVNWVNNTLGIERNANVLWQGDENFDFRIFNNPKDVETEIRKKAEQGFSARMTAGFCWPWSKKINSDGTLIKDVVIDDYIRPWNARPEATKLATNIPKSNYWAYDPNGINQVGCIYTAQGFEFDYVGVLFGKDLIYDFDKQDWIGRKQYSFDIVVKRSKDKFVDLVKNTYRVLLSRGLKGCYVCFLDKETERFFRSRMDLTKQTTEKEAAAADELVKYDILPLQLVYPPEANPFENCVPLYDLKIAASGFSDEQQAEVSEWVKLPEFIRPSRDLFIAQVVGESMNRRIPNGSWCLFRFNPVGSRQGKVVLVKHREIQDTDTGGHFTVKVYESEKRKEPDGSWRHMKIVLHPDTNATSYEPIILYSDQIGDLQVIAELVAVLT